MSNHILSIPRHSIYKDTVVILVPLSLPLDALGMLFLQRCACLSSFFGSLDFGDWGSCCCFSLRKDIMISLLIARATTTDTLWYSEWPFPSK